jgi:hypothetical protein
MPARGAFREIAVDSPQQVTLVICLRDLHERFNSAAQIAIHKICRADPHLVIATINKVEDTRML